MANDVMVQSQQQLLNVNADEAKDLLVCVCVQACIYIIMHVCVHLLMQQAHAQFVTITPMLLGLHLM